MECNGKRYEVQVFIHAKPQKVTILVCISAFFHNLVLGLHTKLIVPDVFRGKKMPRLNCYEEWEEKCSYCLYRFPFSCISVKIRKKAVSAVFSIFQ